MNEVHFGAPWPRSFAALFRAKVADARALRAVALEGARLTPQRAHALGVVDEVGGQKTEEVLARAVGLAKGAAPGARSGVWGLIKVRACAGTRAAVLRRRTLDGPVPRRRGGVCAGLPHRDARRRRRARKGAAVSRRACRVMAHRLCGSPRGVLDRL
jgi:enoyl-CoA hydratase/carnithine racemase